MSGFDPTGTLQPDALAGIALQEFAAHHLEAGEVDTAIHSGPAVLVQRLDQPGRAYFLVPIHDASRLRGIVQIDSHSGRVETSARIAGPNFQFLLPVAAAMQAARKSHPKLSGWGEPYLGWRPSRESLDSMSPLWVVPHPGGAVYVNQKGRSYDALTFA